MWSDSLHRTLISERSGNLASAGYIKLAFPLVNPDKMSFHSMLAIDKLTKGCKRYSKNVADCPGVYNQQLNIPT